jgi:hypothetical protein
MTTTNVVENGTAGAQRPHQDLRRHSVWTLAALGFLAYYITVMWHEIIGHGFTAYLLGARHFVLTSTSMTSPGFHGTAGVASAPDTITLGLRFVFLDGPLSNGVLGLVLYQVYRSATRRNANLTLRYFLWLLTALNFFLGFVYMFYSGVFGFGDYALAIQGLPHPGLLRVLEVIVSTLLCIGTVRFFAPSFGEFPENLWRLALVPYVSATFFFCLAGLRIPNGAQLMLISVIPASLMGQAILLFVTPPARRLRVAVPAPQAIPTSPAVIAVGLVFVVIILLTAPGVHFTVP